jgi:hypothetical protein
MERFEQLTTANSATAGSVTLLLQGGKNYTLRAVCTNGETFTRAGFYGAVSADSSEAGDSGMQILGSQASLQGEVVNTQTPSNNQPYLWYSVTYKWSSLSGGAISIYANVSD